MTEYIIIIIMCYSASLPPSYSMSSLPPWFINCNDHITSHQSGKSHSPVGVPWWVGVGGSQSFVISLVNISLYWDGEMARWRDGVLPRLTLADWLDHSGSNLYENEFCWCWWSETWPSRDLGIKYPPNRWPDHELLRRGKTPRIWAWTSHQWKIKTLGASHSSLQS